MATYCRLDPVVAGFFDLKKTGSTKENKESSLLSYYCEHRQLELSLRLDHSSWPHLCLVTHSGLPMERSSVPLMKSRTLVIGNIMPLYVCNPFEVPNQSWSLLHPFPEQKLGLIYAAPPLIVAMLGLLVGIPILIIYCVGRCCCNKCKSRLRHPFDLLIFFFFKTKLVVILIWWTSWTLNAAYEENGERRSGSSLKMAWFSASSFVSLWLVLCMHHSPVHLCFQSS